MSYKISSITALLLSSFFIRPITGVTCLLSFSLAYLWNKFYFLSVTFLLSPAQTVILSLIKLEVHNGHHYFPPGIYCLMTRTVFSKLQSFLNLSSFLFSIYLLFEREREVPTLVRVSGCNACQLGRDKLWPYIPIRNFMLALFSISCSILSILH